MERQIATLFSKEVKLQKIQTFIEFLKQSWCSSEMYGS